MEEKYNFKIRLGFLHMLFDEFEDGRLINFSLKKGWTKSLSAKQDKVQKPCFTCIRKTMVETKKRIQLRKCFWFWSVSFCKRLSVRAELTKIETKERHADMTGQNETELKVIFYNLNFCLGLRHAYMTRQNETEGRVIFYALDILA